MENNYPGRREERPAGRKWLSWKRRTPLGYKVVSTVIRYGMQGAAAAAEAGAGAAAVAEHQQRQHAGQLRQYDSMQQHQGSRTTAPASKCICEQNELFYDELVQTFDADPKSPNCWNGDFGSPT